MITLSNEIAKALKEYTTEVEEGLEKAKQKVAREGAKKLRETSPRRKGGKRRKYAEGWTTKKQGSARVIHNKTNYQLTHLLEKGHLKRGGVGRVPGIKHIQPVEEQVIESFEKEVEKVIRG